LLMLKFVKVTRFNLWSAIQLWWKSPNSMCNKSRMKTAHKDLMRSRELAIGDRRKHELHELFGGRFDNWAKDNAQCEQTMLRHAPLCCWF
jgi:hypothetical protein